jgi:membrane protease subunit (stomatin/prohibitin family)
MAIIDRVKYNGTPDVFAWKYPSEALSTWTELIVNSSQQAVLFRDGVACDLFEAGSYTLDTDNIPVLRRFVSIPYGGKSPFAAEVWYVNLLTMMDIRWGTETPVQVQDPKYGILVPVRSYGQFGIRVVDARKLLQKLVGTLPSFGKSDVTRHFRGLFATRIKDVISNYLINKGVSVLEISAYLDQISQYMKEQLAPELADYGFEVVNFYVNDISFPDNDPAVQKLRDALAKRAEMGIVGYSYEQERSFDTMEKAAANSSGGGPMGASIGLGMGIGIGDSMAEAASKIGKGLSIEKEPEKTEKAAEKDRKTKFCPECGTEVPARAKFCIECGYTLVLRCSKCGTVLQPGTKFCPECGARAAETAGAGAAEAETGAAEHEPAE